VAKTLYFDSFSGASGDMVLGALLDLGLPIDALRGALGSLAIDYGTVDAEQVLRAGVSATKFRVHETHAPSPPLEHVHSHRHDHAHAGGHDHTHDQHHPRPERGQDHSHHSLKEISGYIARSALSAHGKERALHLFERLAQAEAAIHAVPIDRVHLHEVGAVDSIIDIVGAVYAMEWVGADHVAASALNVGRGVVTCAHGTFPVPAPATMSLLKGVPIYSGEIEAELVTPTGALLVTEYASEFGPLPALRVESIGYGAGDRDFPRNPNVLRVILGEAADVTPEGLERIVTIECEIDDMNPQLYGPLMDRLHTVGALDVFYAAVQMKKNRPGTLVTIIARPAQREAIVATLFAETTTIGVRHQEMRRERLDREIRTIDTPAGPIRFKLARRAGRLLNAAPEFEDCARAAAERGLAIKDVQALAVKAWLDSGGSA
jgi:uncharacterized protein (TIGR00299 family) protein